MRLFLSGWRAGVHFYTYKAMFCARRALHIIPRFLPIKGATLLEPFCAAPFSNVIYIFPPKVLPLIFVPASRLRWCGAWNCELESRTVENIHWNTHACATCTGTHEIVTFFTSLASLALLRKDRNKLNSIILNKSNSCSSLIYYYYSFHSQELNYILFTFKSNPKNADVYHVKEAQKYTHCFL